jgi:hypothetical protein
MEPARAYTMVHMLRAAACCCVHVCMLLTLDRTFSAAFRCSLSQMANLERLPFVPKSSYCLEPRGDGWRAALGAVCIFPASHGR